jgi:DNA-binding NtrC family response regulator
MITATVEARRGFSKNPVRTVLVVEDEEGIRFCATEFLRDCGYNVVEASTVAEAKEVLLQGQVNLVFSDINLPNRETGFALEKWVRRQYPEIKVLLTSGAPQAAEDTRDLLEPLIAKPYKLSMLESRIERLLCGSDSLVA